MSRVLQVSRSGFYVWRKRESQPSTRQQHRKHMDDAVKQDFDAKNGRSGSPGLTLDLADAGQQYDRKVVAESMRRQEVQSYNELEAQFAGSA